MKIELAFSFHSALFLILETFFKCIAFVVLNINSIEEHNIGGI